MKRFALAVGVLVALAAAAHAAPYQVPGLGQDMPKNGTGVGGANGNDPADNFFRLETVEDAYDAAHPGSPLPEPITTGEVDLGSYTVTGTGLAGFDYAVLHYGAGPGGTSGGGVEVFYLAGASSFSFPANGTGPNGNGGFSSLSLFKGIPTPDGGLTVALMGLALLGLGWLCRRERRKPSPPAP